MMHCKNLIVRSKNRFRTCDTGFQVLPAFRKRTRCDNLADEMSTVFQFVWKSMEHQFDWSKERPQEPAYSIDFVASCRKPRPSWLSVWPVEEETTSLADPCRAAYVSMGGGIGHQCADFEAALFPFRAG